MSNFYGSGQGFWGHIGHHRHDRGCKCGDCCGEKIQKIKRYASERALPCDADNGIIVYVLETCSLYLKDNCSDCANPSGWVKMSSEASNYIQDIVDNGNGLFTVKTVEGATWDLDSNAQSVATESLLPPGVHGQLVYTEDTNKMYFFNGTEWIMLNPDSGGGEPDEYVVRIDDNGDGTYTAVNKDGTTVEMEWDSFFNYIGDFPSIGDLPNPANPGDIAWVDDEGIFYLWNGLTWVPIDFMPDLDNLDYERKHTFRGTPGVDGIITVDNGTEQHETYDASTIDAKLTNVGGGPSEYLKNIVQSPTGVYTIRDQDDNPTVINTTGGSGGDTTEEKIISVTSGSTVTIPATRDYLFWILKCNAIDATSSKLPFNKDLKHTLIATSNNSSTGSVNFQGVRVTITGDQMYCAHSSFINVDGGTVSASVDPVTVELFGHY